MLYDSKYQRNVDLLASKFAATHQTVFKAQNPF